MIPSSSTSDFGTWSLPSFLASQLLECCLPLAICLQLIALKAQVTNKKSLTVRMENEEERGSGQASTAFDITTLIRDMERVLIDDQGGPSQPMDEISALTDYSMPLSDIYEVGDNGEQTINPGVSVFCDVWRLIVLPSCLIDVIFARPGEHVMPTSHSGNRHFRRLLHDYKELYRSTAEEEDQGVVVAEVVRIWRSREPPGRFLDSTDPAEASFPLHDIGDDDARRRTSKLLRRGHVCSTKHRDDVTASTAGSSTITRRESTGPGRGAKRAPRTECFGFGGSFRGLVVSLFASNKDSIMNQYLP